MPGNSSYSETVRYGRNFPSSAQVWLRGSKWRTWTVRVRPFPGATVKQLYHYVIPTLTDNTAGTIIIQGGCSLSNKNSNREDIAKATAVLGNLCCSHGVNQVLNSSLICGKKLHLNNKVKQISFLLKLICQKTILFLLITMKLLLDIYGSMVSTL